MAGLIVAAVETVLVAPIALPAVVVTVVGYLANNGAIATAVSQSATGNDADCEEEKVIIV
ncbi:MAG: hypothetical protein R2779_04355 [Crocinitomicaceae bacterium]